MSRKPPIKYKCMGCGFEEWIVLGECCCYDYCSCGEVRCGKCRHYTVPKSTYIKELVGLIDADLAQLLEWDENYNLKETYNNTFIKLALEKLKKIEKYHYKIE